MIKCGHCKKIKEENCFYKDKGRKNGFGKTCKICRREYASQKDGAAKKYFRKYYEKHKEKLKESFKKNYLATKDRRDLKGKEWLEKNHEKWLAWTRKYRKENLEKKRKYGREYVKRKYATDAKFRLKNSLHSGINSCLKTKKNRKAGRKWQRIVGFTLEMLMAHLEKKFKDGMCWENYGEWHMDHIKPIKLFNYNSPEDSDFKECWSLENLQPLWANENLKKGYKYP